MHSFSKYFWRTRDRPWFSAWYPSLSTSHPGGLKHFVRVQYVPGTVLKLNIVPAFKFVLNKQIWTDNPNSEMLHAFTALERRVVLRRAQFTRRRVSESDSTRELVGCFWMCVKNKYLLILGFHLTNVSWVRQLELWVNLKPGSSKVIEGGLGIYFLAWRWETLGVKNLGSVVI